MGKLRHRGVTHSHMQTKAEPGFLLPGQVSEYGSWAFLGVASFPSSPGYWLMASPGELGGGEGFGSIHLGLVCHLCTQRCCTPSRSSEVGRSRGCLSVLGNHRAAWAWSWGVVEEDPDAGSDHRAVISISINCTGHQL